MIRLVIFPVTTRGTMRSMASYRIMILARASASVSVVSSSWTWVMLFRFGSSSARATRPGLSLASFSFLAALPRVQATEAGLVLHL